MTGKMEEEEMKQEAAKHPGRDGERWAAGGYKQNVNQGVQR